MSNEEQDFIQLDPKEVITRMLPPGTPWVLIADTTTLSEQVSDSDNGQWACRVEVTEPTGQNYLTTRALIEYARDERKQNFVYNEGEES